MRKSYRHLARKRGAAMAEGAVVLPVLAVFFGVMMYVHNSYYTKLDIQHDTRHLAFSNAAHACKDLGWETTHQRLDPGPLPKEGDAPDTEKDMSLDTRPFFWTRGNATQVAVALGRSRKVTAQSRVFCNPYVIAFYEPPGARARALQYLAAGIQAGFWKMLKFAGHSMQYLGQWTGGFITDLFD